MSTPGVAIPNVVGDTLAAAEAALTAAGLGSTAGYGYSSTIAAGSIISQTPAAGVNAHAGTVVALVGSLGPIVVPNIVGETVSAATVAVVGLGLSLAASANALSATVPAGSIISQSPAAGALASTGALVSYVVSLGYPPVPTLTGLTAAAAETALTAASFTLGTVTAIQGPPPAGVVTGFHPTGAQPAGTPINLVISLPVYTNRATSMNTRLLTYLHRVFDKTPEPFLALRIGCAQGGLTWAVSDATLTLTPAIIVGGAAAPLTVALAGYTVTSLAQFLGSQPGYVVPYRDTSALAGLSALVLIDGNGDVAASNGDHLFGYTNLLWSYINAIGSELGLAQSQIVNMLLQMSTTTASEEFLDLLGTYYKVPRNVGELDSAYGPRIISNVLLPSSNNVGMALAQQCQFPGTTAQVIDAILDAGARNLRDGSIHFNSAALHNSFMTGDSGGLFDVVLAFDFAGPVSATQYLPLLVAAVNGYRAAGTFMREIRLKDGINAATLASSTYYGPILVEVYNP